MSGPLQNYLCSRAVSFPDDETTGAAQKQFNERRESVSRPFRVAFGETRAASCG